MNDRFFQHDTVPRMVRFMRYRVVLSGLLTQKPHPTNATDRLNYIFVVWLSSPLSVYIKKSMLLLHSSIMIHAPIARELPDKWIYISFSEFALMLRYIFRIAFMFISRSINNNGIYYLVTKGRVCIEGLT